jgi:hypothetical protein
VDSKVYMRGDDVMRKGKQEQLGGKILLKDGWAV